jgi:hypothetical protein
MCCTCTWPYFMIKDHWKRSKYYEVLEARDTYPSGYYRPPRRWLKIRNSKTKEPRGHTTSSLFKLPLEVRDMIYKLVLGEAEGIHILLNYPSRRQEGWLYSRLYSVRCNYSPPAVAPPHGEENTAKCTCSLDPNPIVKLRAGSGGYSEDRPRGCLYEDYTTPAVDSFPDFGIGVLSVLLTCRIM